MKKQRGMTLIELLVTIAVLAGIAALAVPNFRGMVQSNRASNYANDLVTAVNMARSEAIRRGGGIRLCSSNNQQNCTGETDWAVGWVVRSEADDEVIRVWGPLAGGATMEEDNGLSQVDFAGDGTVDAQMALSLEIHACPYFRDITLSRVGRTNVSFADC